MKENKRNEKNQAENPRAENPRAENPRAENPKAENEGQESINKNSRTDDEKMLEYPKDTVMLEDEEGRSGEANPDADNLPSEGSKSGKSAEERPGNDEDGNTENESIEGAMNNPAIPQSMPRSMEYTSTGIPYERGEMYGFGIEWALI